MKEQNPFKDYNKHKASDKKRHDQRHPKGAYGHYCNSWLGHYICDECQEFKSCECGRKPFPESYKKPTKSRYVPPF